MKYSCGRLARFLVWASMIVALPAQAVICKMVDENGVVGYTDTPRSECANPVQLPGYSRYAPRPVAGVEDNPQQAQPGQPDQQVEFNGYTSMQIVAPQNFGTIHNNEGTVTVQIELEPALQQGHTVRLILDGKSAGDPAASTNIALTNVDRGTHSLSAQVLDENGKLLRSVGPIRFTLQKEALEPSEGDSGPQGDDVFDQKYDPEQKQQNKFVPQEDQGKSYDSTPPSNDTFKSDGQSENDFKASPDTYKPGSTSSGSRTNPAFTPHYNQK
jgi:hypothetical protein